jgi:hypothetical protein
MGAFVGDLLVPICKQDGIALILSSAAADARKKVRLLGVWDAC